MKNFLKYFFGFIIILVVIFFAGPSEKFEKINNIPVTLDIDLEDIEAYVADKESKIDNIKKDNHARILWQDSLRQTSYAVVYLHGYSASHGEGYPIIQNFSKI